MIQAASVVGDDQPEALTFVHRLDGHDPGLGMPADVGEYLAEAVDPRNRHGLLLADLKVVVVL